MNIAIIGAGPGGLTAAHHLRLLKPQYNIEILEASEKVGGLSKSLELWGQTVDLGPHRFFSRDRRVNEKWLSFTNNEYVIIKRLTRIFYQNTFYKYPLQPFDALYKMGTIEAFYCLLSYIVSQRKRKDHSDFESLMIGRFGNHLYQKFFKNYTRKLWGLPPNQLEPDFCQQRIRNFSLGSAIIQAFKNAINQNEFIDTFPYPKHGTGKLWETVANDLIALGLSIQYQKKVLALEPRRDGKISVECAEGFKKSYDHIISTMPLNNLIFGLKHAPEGVLTAASQLNFRDTILVYVLVNKLDLFPDQWLYINDSNCHTGRITNFNNWSSYLNANKAQTILCLEYWPNSSSEQKMESLDIFKKYAKEDLLYLGLAQETELLQMQVIPIRKSYPIYKKGYFSHIDIIKNYLEKFPQIQVIGRNGSFKYNNQDHSMLMGIFAAENIASPRTHELWSTNSDNEYQEETLINQAGLIFTKKYNQSPA